MNVEFFILDRIQSLHGPFLDQCMVMITSLGDKGLVWILIALFLLICKRTRRYGLCMAGALILQAVFCNLMIKPFVARIRPYEIKGIDELLIALPKDYSFPSGHTSASFSATFSLYFAGFRNPFLLCLILSCLIAFSRLYLYVHYPSDVLAGVVLGIFSAYVSVKLMDKV